jgi:LPS export ABC transporter protein LptC
MIKKYFFIAFTVIIVAACKDRRSGIIFDSATMPTQTVYDAKTMFTDRGQLQMLLEQPILYNYEDKEKTQISPKGIEMSFYDKEMGNLEVYIRADSAVNSQASKLMRFYYNVVIYDYRKGDTITTEMINWDQEKRIIYSDVYTRQANANVVTTGTGFDSDEEMNNVVIRNSSIAF